MIRIRSTISKYKYIKNTSHNHNNNENVNHISNKKILTKINKILYLSHCLLYLNPNIFFFA